jgi:spermidine synthase
MLGMVSQIAQVVLLRELLMVFHGNEMSIGVILAAWMAWVGVGSALGAAIAERTDRVLMVLTLNAAVLLPLLAATVAVIRGLRGFFDVVPGAYLSLADILVSSFLVVAPVCLLIGMQFVLLAKLWRQRDRSEDTAGAGKTYVGEAAGNIVGGVIFTFAMVHYLNAFESVVLAGILVGAAVLWAGRRSGEFAQQAPRPLRAVLAAFLVLGGVSLGFLGAVDDGAHRMQWQHLAPDHQLVETHQSKYGNIVIARRDDQYSFFRSGHLMFAAAGPETPVPHFEEQEAAVFAHLAMTQHPRPERVLLIGGGLRGTLGEIVRHPVERVDYVELDPVLTRAAKPFVSGATLAALNAPSVRLVHADGRVFVKEADREYDLIIADVPDPATAVLNRYYTREFFGQVRRLLAPDGVFVIGAVSTAGLRGTAVANRNAAIRHTLGSVFPEVLTVGDRFLVFLATPSPGGITADASLLQQRFLERGIQSEAFSRHHFHLLLEESQLRRVNWVLGRHGRAGDAHLAAPPAAPILPPSLSLQQQAEPELPPVNERFFLNSDFRPIAYFYTLMFWGDLTRAGHTDIFRTILRVEPWWIFPVIGLVIAISLVLRVVGGIAGTRPDRHFAVITAVVTTGLSTMTLQVALLFSFQSVYGFIYEMVGLIIAIFMAGLATGTTLTNRYIRNKANTDVLAAVQLAIAIFAGLIALLLPQAAGVESARAVFVFFALLTFVSGLLNGLDFPLATEAFRAVNRRAERSAGMVYGLELLGACLGAALASAVVVPIIGIVACCLLAALVNATAFAVLMVSRRPHVQ